MEFICRNHNILVSLAKRATQNELLVTLMPNARSIIAYARRKNMNHLLQQSHRIFVALALATILVVQAAPILSSFQIGDAGGWVAPLTECGGDTCG